MDVLVRLILAEFAVALALFIVYLILKIVLMLRKRVVVPGITVTVDKAAYMQGENVGITGLLTEDGSPAPGETVSLKITDPAGSETILPEAITDIAGKFSSVWQVPQDASPGLYTVSATGLGITAHTTFTLSMRRSA